MGSTAGNPEFQEARHGGVLIPAVVVTGHPGHPKESNRPYNHNSLLATIETVWHLGYQGHSGDVAGGAVTMLDLIGIGGTR